MTLARILLLLVLAFGSLTLEFSGAEAEAQDLRAVLLVDHVGLDPCDPSGADPEASTPATPAARLLSHATDEHLSSTLTLASRPLGPPFKPPRAA